MKALELKNVSFRYDASDAGNVLNGCDFSLEYGKLALLVGTSGAGKSTLFWVINGIVPSVVHGTLTGEILIDGEDARDTSTGARSRKIGSVLQNADAQIIQPLVADEIAFGCENLGIVSREIENRVRFGCESMELHPNGKTRTLSGGQKQRLVTAATLAMGQKILILDEPLANLDAAGAERLMRALSAHAKSGYAVLVIEHRIDKVLPYADAVYELRSGKTEKIADRTAFLAAYTKKIADTSERKPSDETLFELKNVSYCVKKRQILKDVGFRVKRGERLVILGENGCGKTTLTKIVARLLKQSGGIVTQNLDPKFGNGKRGSSKWFKKVAYVYQNPNYQLFMPTVEQELLFGGESLAYCQKIVDLFGLRPLLHRHPQSLSEGQKRKVSIAVMLAAKPEVLILDEPTVGQDYEGLKNLARILNEIHDEEQNTMITITHDVRCAEALCDKAVLIENGVAAKSGGKELIREYFESHNRNI